MKRNKALQLTGSALVLLLTLAFTGCASGDSGSQVNALQNDLGSLKTKISSLEENLGALKAKNTELEGKIQVLEGQVNALRVSNR